MEYSITTSERPLPKKLLKRARRKELIQMIRVLEANLTDAENALTESLLEETRAQERAARAEHARAQADGMLASVLDDLLATEVQQEVAEATVAALSAYATETITRDRQEIERLRDHVPAGTELPPRPRR